MQVFTELFHDMRAYLRGSQLALDVVLDEFFSALLLRMFTLLNGQYVFDDRYLGCVADLHGRRRHDATAAAADLEAFGDVPHKLRVQVKRALVAARTFHQALAIGADVVAALGTVDTPHTHQGGYIFYAGASLLPSVL